MSSPVLKPPPAPPTLHRTAFTTSRELEFFTEKELTMQLGVERRRWPLALLKELIDNALDACESSGVAPRITVTLEPDALTVTDNGPGLPSAVLEHSLNYFLRVSDKAYYVSPTRGQLGNALKGVWAAPFVVSGTVGQVRVQTATYQAEVAVRLDPLAQQTAITVEHTAGGFVKSGTSLTMHWPGLASEVQTAALYGLYNLRRLLCNYGVFNPHATFIFVSPTLGSDVWPATQPDWSKWLPSAPTSPHWYSVAQFRDLLGAYVHADRMAGRSRLLTDVLAEFQGLKGSGPKQVVTTALGLSRATLDDLVDGTALNPAMVQRLLEAMQARARVLKPETLGVLGESHLHTRLSCDWGVAAETFAYKRLQGTCPGLPYVLEVACGWPEQEAPYGARVFGLNWSPTLKVPFPAWDALTNTVNVDEEDEVCLIVHLACPRVEVTDRAKSTAALPDAVGEALRRAVTQVTKRWQALKRQIDKETKSRDRAKQDDLKRQRAQRITIKDAAWQVMEAAYLKASANGRLPANARQIMYAARPMVIALRGNDKIWSDDQQFTQGYLPDFVAAHPDLTATWVVAYDARGHFREPHTGTTFGLGTLEVQDYRYTWGTPSFTTPAGVQLGLDQVATSGPMCRYTYVLFLEKEGFDALLEAGQIAQRYDVGIMSTKGQTVTAARALIEALSKQGVTFLVAHDFDKAGIEILDKFSSSTRRYTYTSQTNVIDLGLRLTDVKAMGLEREREDYGKDKDPRANLRRCGASEAECCFLAAQTDHWGQWHGERVELNAMISDQFLAWLEAKFAEHGVTKVVPDATTLGQAYQHLARNAQLQTLIDEAIATLPAPETFAIPDGLEAQIRTAIAGTALAWDEALWRVARAS